ncbi:MAG TPA: hypothetical protein VFP72_21055 [Kineosporiaceae bacterium]|nr:hypothetical protein [Kineosporiaceae bacterium]
MAQVVDRRSGVQSPVVVAEAEENDGISLTAEQLHSQSWRLIQNLADALPDDVVRFARQAWATDQPGQALAAVLFSCIQLGTTLTTVEYAVLAECLFAVGDDASLLDHVTVGDVERQVLFEFVSFPESAEDVAGAAEAGLDLESVVREVDRAVGAGFGVQDAAVGVWRAWRYPVTGAAWPRPTPVYLVEVRDDAAAVELATAYYASRDGLPVSGEPIVEVYPSGTELPPLHRAVQFAGELVFAAADAPDFAFADVFDGEPDADGLPQNITRVSPEEAERLITYLLSGTPMLVADTQGEDVLDPSRGQVVPLHLRTDGTWVWSDASVYYLREHLIGPPPAFHAYLHTVAETAERVSDVTLHQAVAWLQSS